MFMDPKALLSLCNILSTDSVADFGSGSGFMAKAAAALAPQGTVFAVEVHRELLAHLTREVADAHIKNIHPLWGDIEVPGGSKLADGSINFAIVSNVLFSLDDKAGALTEVRRVLKDGGRLLVVDWSESFGGMGPRPEMVVPKSVAIALGERLGFSVLTDTMPAGAHHYAILFKK